MGEMADYFVDRMLDRMVDSYWGDDDDQPTQVRCRGCRKLFDWHHTGERWVMLDSKGKRHDCRAQPAAVDDFPLLDNEEDPAQGLG